MTSVPQVRPSLPTVVSIVLAGVSGGAIMIVLPGVLAALASQRGLSGGQVALLASAEMLGLTLATFAAAAVIGTIDRRRLATGTLLVLILAQLLSVVTKAMTPFLVVRLGAGCCEGIMLALMTASATSTSQPDRVFATYMASNLAVATGVLLLLGQLVAYGSAPTIYIALAAIAGVALCLTSKLPATPPPPQAAIGVERVDAVAWVPALIGLAGTLIIFVAIGATWPLMGRFGQSLGISDQVIAGTLSLAAVSGIVSGVIVAVLGDGIGRRLPLVAGSLALAGVMIFLSRTDGVAGYRFGAVAVLFLMVFIVPYYTAIMGLLDRSGRMASLSMGIQFAGLAIGPALAAPFVTGGFGPILTIAAALCVPATVLMVIAERGIKMRGSHGAGAAPVDEQVRRNAARVG